MPTIKTYRKVGAFYIACEEDFSPAIRFLRFVTVSNVDRSFASPVTFKWGWRPIVREGRRASIILGNEDGSANRPCSDLYEDR